QICDTGACIPPILSDTGDKPAPTTAYELTFVDPADPVKAAQKRLDLATNYSELLAAVDIPDSAADGQIDAAVGGGVSYTHYLTSVPYYLQERSYWCGPATTRQIAGFFNSSPPSQTFMADKLGTTRDGTWFPMVAKVMNDRRPNDGPWLLDDIETHGDLISRMDYGYNNRTPGALHVKLLKTFYNYYAFDHDGHIATSSGLRRNGKRYFGGYTDPYNEAHYRSGGASTGGFRENRIFNLYDATIANSADMIF
ncbi:MAG TPA: C39 family peptidase, partial [Actinomycetota bacterium]|nr:C39 family peptidase [Actinomycetota bacterium]